MGVSWTVAGGVGGCLPEALWGRAGWLGGEAAWLLEVESWTVRELESSARPSEVFGDFCFVFKYSSIYLAVPGLS